MCRSCASSPAAFAAVKDEPSDVANPGASADANARQQQQQQQQLLMLQQQEHQQQLPLLDRLLQLHVRECQREVTWSSHLNPCSNLLAALCKRENPSRLVLTLRPGNEGYTLHLVGCRHWGDITSRPISLSLNLVMGCSKVSFFHSSNSCPGVLTLCKWYISDMKTLEQPKCRPHC